MLDRFRPPRVKVCGLTRAEDVRAAASAGAEAIGLVCHPASPRHVELELARSLVGCLPPHVAAIAVVVDGSLEQVLAWSREVGASAVQLCGAQVASDWEGFELPILRRVGVDAAAAEEIGRWREVARAFVLDHPGGPGGTGRQVDLDLAAELASENECLLAGGLDAENVGTAVRRVRPAGVDASSRLELAPGKKDPERIRSFVARALAALEAGEEERA